MNPQSKQQKGNLLRRTGVGAMAAVLLAASTLAVAQPNDWPGQRDNRQNGRHFSQQDRHGPANAAARDRNHAPPRAQGPQFRHSGMPDGRGDHRNWQQRGAGPDRSWHRGGRVPPQYRTRHYVVSDWRGHHLSAPPRGYHWVQNGSDYLLVAIATGVIAQMILNN